MATSHSDQVGARSIGAGVEVVSVVESEGFFVGTSEQQGAFVNATNVARGS